MLNSDFVHFMRTAFNPFMPNGISIRYQLEPLWCLIWVCTICLCPTKRTLGIYGLKMQLFCLSHKSCRNLGSVLLK